MLITPWLICLLHPNELLLRQLIQHLDGKPNHPTGFKGAIGKILENCEKLSVILFEPIEVELPNIDPKEFSTDQKYLFDICDGISRGNILMSLSLIDPGKISHSFLRSDKKNLILIRRTYECFRSCILKKCLFLSP